MQWLSSHHDVLSLAVDIITMLVWLFYAHLLLSNYRRQRRPVLLVSQGAGGGIDSRCLISNMSHEVAYVALVIAQLETSQGCWECNITDQTAYQSNDGEQENDSKLSELTFQGPLQSGGFRELHSFKRLINHVLREQDKPDLDDAGVDDLELRCFSVYVIALYGAEDKPVGASRSFRLLNENAGYRLQPTSTLTFRMTSRRARKQVQGWLQRYL